jgi:HAD superfamily hydrolase (TIGR01549 family)
MVERKWAILLDLDQTLILTSAIEHLRQQRAWQQAYASFSKTTLPPNTREFIQSASEIGQLGIVTNTPRPYAEKLLAHHRLAIPVVVAYHDTSLHKPHPQPLLKAAEKLRFSSNQCIYVGDAVQDILAAANAKAIPIALTWDGLLDRQEEIKLAKAFCKS